MVGLVRAVGRHAEVVGLLFRQLGQLHTDFFEMQAGDFLVQFLRQAIDADFRGVLVLPQIQLREDLIREAVAHHEARMAGGAAEAHEPAFGWKIFCPLFAFGGIY